MTELEFMTKVLHELDTLKGIGIGLIFAVFATFAVVVWISNSNGGKK